MLFQSSFFGAATLLAFTTPIFAANDAAQDMTTMQATFDHIFTGIDRLVDSVKSFKDKSDVDKIVANAQLIKKELTQGTANVKKSATMSLPDLVNVLGPVMVMESKVGEIVESLSMRKADLKAAGAEVQIRTQLQEEKVAADALVAAILANLPMASVVSIVAGPIAKLITDRLDKGIVEWGGQAKYSAASASAPKGKNAGGSSGVLGGLLGSLGLGALTGTAREVAFTERFLAELQAEAAQRQ